jgi:RNA polymerase sigma-70 factor (ECF subfamily)
LTIHQGIDNHFIIRSKADFEMVFREHYAVLCSYANQFLKDTDLSEEVVQEVMFRLWTQRHQIEIESSIRSYLFRAVRNGCMNLLNHGAVKRDYKLWKEGQTIDSQYSGEDSLIISELQERIRVAIDNLPLERRKIFIHSRYDGFTYQQIADKLGISVKTVENQMSKALKTLREELRDYLPWLVIFFADIFRR